MAKLHEVVGRLTGRIRARAAIDQMRLVFGDARTYRILYDDGLWLDWNDLENLRTKFAERVAPNVAHESHDALWNETVAAFQSGFSKVRDEYLRIFEATLDKPDEDAAD